LKYIIANFHGAFSTLTGSIQCQSGLPKMRH
jgi:hypothetical protein